MSVAPEQQEPQPSRPARSWRAVDLGLRMVGGLIAVVAGAVTAVLELLLAPLRVGGYPIGAAVLVAVLANAALSWFAVEAVGRRWAVALPAVPWVVIMVAAADRTAEGDVLLIGNWVGLTLVVAGAMTFAVVAFRSIVAPPSPGTGRY
ncbi:hypothetical protein [Micromonospora endophytica]|uniref:Uncharacterized protein n=1 Tax=Micromonospora endophytica TaxID=515350 RepID=A0A2W2CR50_9ACTN|nr:hypothetical protein [Micromonospora endophytica]PZF94108.1 hypothetical protein C1I93_17025 [Micromonospora endophytica]RIW44633.1 hypothetical protein D3H59_17045 [Micromonospora endophytica]BCJ60372.1 hypothetical protein Jiend_37940 [Micromonospora endophytica]